MIDTARALYLFWHSFSLDAYTTQTVPDNAQVPYITYSLVETEPTEAASHYAQVFYRATDNVAMAEKVDEIKAAIGTGKLLRTDDGYVCIRPSTPYVQLMTDKDPANRYAYINLQINCYHK